MSGQRPNLPILDAYGVLSNLVLPEISLPALGCALHGVSESLDLLMSGSDPGEELENMLKQELSIAARVLSEINSQVLCTLGDSTAHVSK